MKKSVEDMTIAELKAAAALCAALPSDVSLVRTRGAGVHFGEVETRKGGEVTLSRARRIWYWKGANTLNEIALRGVSQKESKISEEVPSITLLDAVEIIPVSKVAAENLYGAGWLK